MQACSTTIASWSRHLGLPALEDWLHLPQVEFAAGIAEGMGKAQSTGESWGMCSKHCNTCRISILTRVCWVSWLCSTSRANWNKGRELIGMRICMLSRHWIVMSRVQSTSAPALLKLTILFQFAMYAWLLMLNHRCIGGCIERCFEASGFCCTVTNHHNKHDPEWCKFQSNSELYIIPSDSSQLGGLSRVLQQNVT